MANGASEKVAQGITAITVSGFKSLRDESRIEVRPLTILAGANSSGKSSIMQPLLLMKQTLEAPYDPISFLFDGPNINFTSDEQFLNSSTRDESGNYVLQIAIQIHGNEEMRVGYKKFIEDPDIPVVPVGTYYLTSEARMVSLFVNQTSNEIVQQLGQEIEQLRDVMQKISKGNKLQWRVVASRGFVYVRLYDDQKVVMEFSDLSLIFFPIGNFQTLIHELIHVPGLRGNPQREYPVTAADIPRFSGTFENYVASLISYWQSREDERLRQLAQILDKLGLTSYISARALNDAQVEVRVGRALKSGSNDVVSIADVGFGVSQVLPVLVALLVAEPGQLVYIEQPELHLHPRAQVALAQVLADAANRGVRVVAETHSDLLLIGVQTLIAEGKLSPDIVKLHWFERDENGVTHITSSDVAEDGTFENWPEDFSEVALKAQSRYLDAAEAHHIGS